ncbi:MAG: ABC transporter ATP-binding protein [Chlorobi bacterium]|nr:ABC transporter ATP-binding protein [Chlorobiota bacterium]
MKLLWHHLRRYKRIYLVGIVFVLLNNLIAILIPRLLRVAIDSALSKEVPVFLSEYELSQAIVLIAISIVILALLRAVPMYLMRETIIIASRKAERDLRQRVYEHILKVSPVKMGRFSAGNIMVRLTEDVATVRMFYGPVILYTINITALLIAISVSMFLTSPILAAFLLIPLPLLAYFIYRVSIRIKVGSAVVQDNLSAFTSFIASVFPSMRIWKAFNREEFLRFRFDSLNDRLRDESLRLARIEAFFHPQIILATGGITILTVFAGGWYAIHGGVTAGTIAEFIVYVNMLTWPLMAAGWIVSLTQKALASIQRIQEILDMEPYPINGKEPISQVRNVELKDVSFGYDERLVIKGISELFNKPEWAAIVGKPGSGKTTLLYLLNRIIDPQSGIVLLDGTDAKTYLLERLRPLLLYVPREPILFADTIANNVRYAREDLSDEEVIRLLEICEFTRDLESFPAGIHTIVGQKGVFVSGGQKQRIALARALAVEPDWILLDDALSSVDAITEQKILNNLKREFPQMGVIIVTQRVSIAKHASRIFKLENGKLQNYELV